METRCRNNKDKLTGRKTAIIVMGDHFTGKSKTINMLKPMLDRLDKQNVHKKMTKADKYFTLDDGLGEGTFIYGWIYSQSLQEKGWVELGSVHTKIYDGKCDILVLASRHQDDEDSHFLSLTDIIDFVSRRGFRVYITTIIKHDDNAYYQQKANEIFEYIQQAKN